MIVRGLALALAVTAMVAAMVGGVQGGPSCFDHQTETYTSVYTVQDFSDVPVAVTPFFSPGQSERVLAELFLSATSSIDIAVASWESFEGCGAWDGNGCTPEEVRNDAVSPFFVALVNAIHRGVDVRMLVGYCNTTVNPPGKIDQFSFLALTGADVRAYATTDFLHSKYIAVDNTRVAIMSANIDLAAMRYNREAGVIVEDIGNHPGKLSPIVNYTQSVFHADWNRAISYPVDADWPPATMALIKDPTPIPEPPVVYFNASTCSFNVPDPPPTYKAEMDIGVYTLPDAGVENTVIKAIANAKTSIDVYIYVIASDNIVSALVAAKKANPELSIRILVSSYVIPGPFPDYTQAYVNLTAAGIPVHATHDCLGVHHIKVWIIDGESVSVSTNNWAESEFPVYSVFPPGVHGADRGLVFTFKNPDVIAWYGMVMAHDWTQSIPWTPSLIPSPPPPPPPPTTVRPST